MQAKETKLQDIIEGTKQYVVPLFQRTYSWTNKEWNILWKDLVELCETENPRTHFIGSIVNMPTVSVPEGVAKYLLIDGQQRLTTIFIILTLLRNKAREIQNQEFAEEINNTLLVNPYKKENDYFKLMPTQVDRDCFKNYILGKENTVENQLTKAYDFFDKKLRQIPLDFEKLKKIITSYFSVVSIVLDPDDNPYLVFESLNAKGRPLTQADLIRNYFFMRIHVDNQESVYQEFWSPMQSNLRDKMTEFIRHFLMRNGSIVKQTDVYYSLKEVVGNGDVINYISEMYSYSIYYQRLIHPEFEPDTILQKYFRRLNRIEVTTAYPLLLSVYNLYESGNLTKENFVEILKVIENYMIRRFVCGIPTNQLNKIFPTIYPTVKDKTGDDVVEGVKNIIQSKGYPKDNEFILRLKETKLYGAGDRQIKTKLILESIEESYNHKEEVSFDDLTIEHVMPQTLSEWWQEHIGENWEDTHDLYLHTLGNLSLTAYNTELSNDDFPIKQETLRESHLEINKYFEEKFSWKKTDIETRAEYLVDKVLTIWPYFGQENSTSDIQEVTGTTPRKVKILGQYFDVGSWRDVLQQTLNTVADLEPEKFDVLAQNFPRYIGKDKGKFRAIRQLNNGYFFEVNLSAQNVQRLCYQAMETIELTSEDWEVEIDY